MRHFRRGLVALAMGALAACGIDESGLAPIDGGGTEDVVTKSEGGADVVADVVADVPLPPSCATTDVSCFGFDAGVPDGWTPFVLAEGDAGCPAGDFTGSPWVTNPSLAPGACECGCTASGSWSCPAAVNVQNGLNCSSASIVNVAQCQNQNSAHIQLAQPATATGNVTCAPDASAPAAQSDPVSLCAAGCDAGAAAVCGQAAGQRCIAADGVQSCPAGLGFTQHVVGASASGSCEACTCDPSAAPTCAASATVYYGYFQSGYNANNSCATGGNFTSQTIALNGTCQALSGLYDSFEVNLAAPPAASCTPTGGGGDAGLAAPKTVCCK